MIKTRQTKPLFGYIFSIFNIFYEHITFCKNVMIWYLVICLKIEDRLFEYIFYLYL